MVEPRWNFEKVEATKIHTWGSGIEAWERQVKFQADDPERREQQVQEEETQPQPRSKEESQVTRMLRMARTVRMGKTPKMAKRAVPSGEV